MEVRHAVPAFALPGALSRRIALRRLGAGGAAAVLAALALGRRRAGAQEQPAFDAVDTVSLFFEQVINPPPPVAAETVDQYLDAGFVDQHNAFAYPHPETGFPGLDGYDALRTAIPDMRFEVDTAIADGDLVMAFTTLTGTHTGAELFGVAPTDRPVEVQGLDMFVLRGSKLAQHWGFADVFTMLDQLQGRTRD